MSQKRQAGLMLVLLAIGLLVLFWSLCGSLVVPAALGGLAIGLFTYAALNPRR